MLFWTDRQAQFSLSIIVENMNRLLNQENNERLVLRPLMAMLQLGMPSKGYLIGTDYINFNPNVYMEEEQILKILLRLASFDKKMLYISVKEGLMKILKKPSYVDKIMRIYKM